MSRLLIFAVLTICIAFNYAADFYPTKYDNVNIDEILNNSRVRKQYSMCYLGTGPCVTSDATFFKEIFTDAIATKCKKCTEKQKEIFEKIVVFYMREEPEVWRTILGNLIKGRRSS
ncbi:ejaculatory bulb-specific protein 3-like [Leptopilina heterotoma]|uniref:ejaculatory bulb-specific protein 3-like n=1 Tax=Leptopilina heterotoma TaxID=63436 RepID=UPI001CA9A562|nr:ejaculatory bulb-specific protein 3-like [Leptopilina heterotoma]